MRRRAGLARAVFVAAVAALHVLAPHSAALTEQCQSVENNTCVFNSSFTALDVTIDEQRDVWITGGARIVAIPGSIRVRSTGLITVDGEAQLTAVQDVSLQATEIVVTGGAVVGRAGRVRLLANCTVGALGVASELWSSAVTMPGKVEIGSHASVVATSDFLSGDIVVAGAEVSIAEGASVNASGVATIGSASDFGCLCSQAWLLGSGSSITGARLQLACNAPLMRVAVGASLVVTSDHGLANISNANGSVYLEDWQRGVVAPRLIVSASGDANISSAFSFRAGNATLQVTAGGRATLGYRGQWVLGRLEVWGESVDVTVQRISTQGTTCGFSGMPPGDVCANTMESGALPRVGAPVTFDFAVVARGALAVAPYTTMSAASLLLCAGASASLGSGAVLDAVGRGCGPGRGSGHGNAGQIGEEACGAGGGSSFGRGGYGAKFNSLQVTPCELPGTRTRWRPDAERLPTAAAPGGGCGLPEPACSRQLTTDIRPSAGGGLIWLSAPTLTIQSGAAVRADGVPGAETEQPPGSRTADDGPGASGGGSGGQIFVYASALNIQQAAGSGDPLAMLSAKGGDISCTRRHGSGDGVVGGAGGGGFIGLHLPMGGPQPAAPQNQSLALSVGGGAMSVDCSKLGVQPRGLDVAFAQGGLTASIVPCAEGTFGPFCSPCGRGMWGAGNIEECRECKNKPTVDSRYTAIAWPNSSCPYACPPGFPDMQVNPKCWNNFAYAFRFFGGTKGAVAIMTCLALLCMFLLWRHANRNKRPQRPAASASFLSRACLSVLQCMRQGCRDGQDDRDRRPDDDFHFPREYLPHHVCRVFLDGQNCGGKPWALPAAHSGDASPRDFASTGIGPRLHALPPAPIERLVRAEGWARLAREFDCAAVVSRVETKVQLMLRYLYPPLAPFFGRWRRRRRAHKLLATVQQVSDFHGSSEGFWVPLRAHRPHTMSEGELKVRFGCDPGATVGYLDFFDFGRSAFDWALVDLRREVWSLTAGGFGTRDEPFAIDARDPLLGGLAHSPFGLAALCSVVSTFNRVARCLSMQELQQGASGAAKSMRLEMLFDKVLQCSERCDLGGAVVVATVEEACRRVDDAHSTLSFNDLVPSFSPTSERVLRPSVNEAPHGDGVWRAATLTDSVEAPTFRLCLAFTTVEALPEARPLRLRPGDDAARATPTETSRLLEQVLQRSPPSSFCAPEPDEATADSCLARRVVDIRRQWRRLLLLGRASPHPMPPTTVLLLVVGLLFVDALLFILSSAMLGKVSKSALAVCFFLPPLVQPTELVLGAWFLLSERPELGRLFAGFVMYSVLGATIQSLALEWWASRGSWPFVLSDLLFICLLKLALFKVAGAHIVTLESWRDEQSMGACGHGEFIRDIMSSPTFHHANSGGDERGSSQDSGGADRSNRGGAFGAAGVGPFGDRFVRSPQVNRARDDVPLVGSEALGRMSTSSLLDAVATPASEEAWSRRRDDRWSSRGVPDRPRHTLPQTEPSPF